MKELVTNQRFPMYQKSWTYSQGEDDEDNDEHDSENDNDDQDNVSGEIESDNDRDDFVHPNLSTYKADDQEEEKDEEKENDDDDVSSDQMVSTPLDYEITKEEENQEDDDNVMGGEQEDEEDEELYRDLNLNLERRDGKMTDAQVNQEKEEVHVTFTTELPVAQQQISSVSSDLVSKFMNPTPDTGIDSILNPNIQFDIPVNVSVFVTTTTPSSDTIIPQTPIPIIQPQQQTHDSTTTTTIPITTLPNIPNFASIFGFERRVSSLETELSELKQTNQFAKAVSSIPGIVDNYLAFKMKDEVNVAIQLKSNKLREEAQAENEEFLNQIESNIKAIIKDQTSYAAAESLSEFGLKKILIDKINENKSMNRSDVQKNLYNALIESYNSNKDLFASYGDVVTLKRGRDDQDKDEEPSTGSNQGMKRRRSGKEESSKEVTQKESKSTSSSKGATRSQPKSSRKSAQVEEHDVNARLWNLPGSQTPDHEWNKTKTVDDRPPQSWMTPLAQASGTQSSFNEFLATPIDFSAFIMNRLKINNMTQDVLTGLTYDLMKGTCKSVVELEYHLEEVFKATNDQLDWYNLEARSYPHDLSKPLPLIQNARGHQVILFDHFINNDLEYLKRGSLSQRYTTSITKTKAFEYGHVKWIKDKVPRSDFKRLHRQDIEDMLLLLVQGKLTNLNLDERFALNVALRMYTRCIVIQEHLQKITPYTAYPDIQGIIYQDDMEKNRLMHTDELHKFNDGTLNHVRTALNDIATGIQMEYLPKRKWTKQDKQRAQVMINAIDKKLRDRRLMRSQEKFVGGRPYRGDLRLLQRTI
ncbi:hypothetical protein Tco_1492685 [Tanacetum coccineum]